jgi:hypothetical protein
MPVTELEFDTFVQAMDYAREHLYPEDKTLLVLPPKTFDGRSPTDDGFCSFVRTDAIAVVKELVYPSWFLLSKLTLTSSPP